MSTAYDKAVLMQAIAAEPGKSVFVSANAGSGKTRVLVERVSRILLTGTNPDKILCLTYTKAAASEMQTRLFVALGEWSIMDQDKLTNELNRLEGKTGPRSQTNLNRARSLFARALETPGGLKVQTIHAFCERLLKRFPLEAGIAPGTDAMDERETRELQQQVWTEIETEAVQNLKSDTAQAITLLSAHKNDQDMDNIYKWAMGNMYKIDVWQKAGGVEPLADMFALAPDDTQTKLVTDFWDNTDRCLIKEAALEMLQSKSSKNNIRGQFILDALTHLPAQGGGGDVLKLDAFNLYKKAFFTGAGAGDYSKTLVFGKDCPQAMHVFGNANSVGLEAARAYKLRDQLRALEVLNLTRAVYTLAVLAVSKYRTCKRARRVMDFSDMIYLTRDLLTNSAAQDWVRYKLDNGVDHILLDEAQDTSESQWDIVGALSEEFFQKGAGTILRTVFAVGDEKQSIYGFQGAEPELFLNKVQNLSKKQPDTPNVNMAMSFRSTKQILSLVDQIFYENKGIMETFDAKFFPPASDKGHHDAHRDDDGIIEFWPAAPMPEKNEDEIPWTPVPVDKLDSRSAREKLAHEIAKQINKWLNSGEPVFDRKTETTRPMRPADILILVQKRTAFFDAVIRNLKEAGVPVAGADRLKLTDSIAVQDMLSLAKFARLPADDLSLAEVLKSPLFGWSDAQLFDIAYIGEGGRKGSLWSALPDGDERRVLSQIKSMASKFAPYEFFARILALVPKDGPDNDSTDNDSTDNSGSSILQKIYCRLGLEAADVLDVFLSRALAHQRRGAPSLQRFITEIETSESSVKREMDAGQNEVRVMTVHGAKGLEAPVVILPDTTQAVDIKNEKFFKAGDGFVIRVAKDEIPEAMQKLIDAKLANAKREAMRLLYVALTRAESRLLVCGFQSAGKVAASSWHSRIEKTLDTLSDVQTFKSPFGDGKRYGLPALPVDSSEPASLAKPDLPSWIHTTAAPPKPALRHLSPSQLVPADDGNTSVQPARSPLSQIEDSYRFTRGNLIHKLLEILPQMQQEKRNTAAHSYLQKQGLEAKDADTLLTEVFGVLDNPDFKHVFSPNSQAEVSLAGGAAELPDDVRLSGQIDRLCVAGDEVWIVDYKSNRPPPIVETDIAPLYIRQMAAYRALTRELYPNKTVRTALLWTDGPHMMTLSDALLDKVNWNDVMSA